MVAVQCAAYSEAIEENSKGAYDHLRDGAVLLYPTAFGVDPNTRNKYIQYGGLEKDPETGERRPVGASALWFNEMLRGSAKALIVCGGGRIAKDNVDYCLHYHPDQPTVFYCRTPARNIPPAVVTVTGGTSAGGKAWCGEVDDYLMTSTVFKQFAIRDQLLDWLLMVLRDGDLTFTPLLLRNHTGQRLKS